jgi:hypothetical protein
MKRRIASIAAVVVAFITVQVTLADTRLPDGWRNLRQAELSDAVRKDSSSRYATAAADFNGDGIEDKALLARATNEQKEALWVTLSNKGGSFRWLKLDEYPASSNSDRGMGIAASKPGVHPYGCFCDAKDCQLGHQKDRPKLKLRDPGLEHFKIESAASMFFWSRSQSKFLCVVLSD